jgi:pilus assembly protein CpaE
MRFGRKKVATTKTRVAMLTADAAFAQVAQDTLSGNSHIDLAIVPGTFAAAAKLDLEGVAAVIIDVDAASDAEMQALQHLSARTNGRPPIIAITQVFDEAVARRLLQMRVADFLAKPVAPAELAQACARVAKGQAVSEHTEAQVYTFVAAVGGAGATTVAIQSAIQLLHAGGRGQTTACLVDLDFQQGSCADYLDLEPRLNLDEIEPRPERLDRQLLEVMLSHHPSGLAVISAPNRPAEMRSFDPDMVMRLLDLVSTHFNYVIFDMPRCWYPWTDSVLLGSNRVFIVSEMTVPGLRHAKLLADAITERLKDGPGPRVIVNRFEQHYFGPGLRRGDVEQTLGDIFAGAIPNQYQLVREAIDRGVPLDEVKPGNKVSQAIKALIEPHLPANQTAAGPASKLSKLKLSFAR